MREAIRKAVEAAKSNPFDRLVGWFDPARGLARLRSRAMLSLAGGYEGARRDRKATKSWRTSGNSPDSDILQDLPALRERSRDLVRNNPIAAGALNTIADGVVATGLSLQSRPDWKTLEITEQQALELGEAIDRGFRMWAESTDCDITRTQNFYGLQDLAFRSCVESGDSFALLPLVKRPGNPSALCVQIIEGDRCQTPQSMRDDEQSISGGVEKDPAGAPVAYHFARRHPGSLTQSGALEFDRIPAFGELTGRRNVLHLFRKLRPGQTRGVPDFAPIIETLKQVGRYADAELMGAVLNASFVAFSESPTGEELQSPVDEGKPASETSKEIGIVNGIIIDVAKGRQMKFADMKRPNTAFDGFVLAMFRQIGAAIGLPFEVLLKHFTASYSASRAALLEVWRFFRQRRAFLALTFCDPVFEAWLELAVANGAISAPGFFSDPVIRRAYLQCEWIADGPGHVDPVKEVQYSVEKIKNRLSSRTREAMRLDGAVWREVEQELAREDAILRSSGALPATDDGPAEEESGDEEDARRERENAQA